MQELSRTGNPIDAVSLSNYLSEQKRLEQAGGISYLGELSGSAPSSANAGHYASIVYDKAALRGLIEAGSIIVELGYNEKEDIESVMDKAEKKVFTVTQSPKGNRFVSMKEVMPDVWNTIEQLQSEEGKQRGVSTGFKGLDKKLSGLQKSDLVILAARPSVGKTSLALDIARKSALENGVKVGIFSLEMNAQSLVDRMLSAESNVDSWKMRTGAKLTPDEYDRIQEAMGRLAAAPIYIDDQAGNSILNMRSTARRLKRENGLDLIIVDYLQLMTTNRHYDSVVNQVSEISRSLKGLARELEVPVLTLSQLSRAVEQRGGKPRLSDLRDSGAIEQDADVVMFIHREDRYKDESERTNIAEILIEKHRNGPTGVVELYFDANKTTFLDIDNAQGYDGLAQAVPMNSSPESDFNEF
jgi:replicative DNA helicase